MRLNIKNAEADRLVRELAALTGETITVAVTESLREKLSRLKSEAVKAPVSKSERAERRKRRVAAPARRPLA